MLHLRTWVSGWPRINTSANMKKNELLNRAIDYALCYVASNWDEWVEEDLGITYEQYQKIIEKFQKSLDEKPANV